MNQPAAIGRETTAAALAAWLKTMADPQNIESMARFGINTTAALGISNPVLRQCAKQAGRNHQRALELWRTDLREAKALALLTADPARLTAQEAWRWAGDFGSWEIVDMAADLFVEARLEQTLIPAMAADEREFVRRAAFAMIASAAVHLKQESDETLIAFLPLIERHARDGRNFVKKAVNWALRNIGKRSRACPGPAMETARALAQSEDRTCRWVGRDALRELTAEKTLARIKG